MHRTLHSWVIDGHHVQRMNEGFGDELLPGLKYVELDDRPITLSEFRQFLSDSGRVGPLRSLAVPDTEQE